MNIGIILVRLDSTRLPGKALRVINGKPLISYCIERAKKIKQIDKLIIATSDRDIDTPLERIASEHDIGIFRGNCADVALRCIECAERENAEFFLRLNGDSPFPDPALVDYGISLIINDRYDIVTNLIPRSYPYGIAVEVINAQSYKNVYSSLQSDMDREHVTSFIYKNPDKFNIGKLPVCVPDLSNIHVTVDTPDDLSMFNKVVDLLGPQVYSADFLTIASTYKSFKENYGNAL